MSQVRIIEDKITPTALPMTEHSNYLVSYFRMLLTFQHEIQNID
jgi:hypothetical protein